MNGINLTQNDSENNNKNQIVKMSFNNTYNDLRIININPIMINKPPNDRNSNISMQSYNRQV